MKFDTEEKFWDEFVKRYGYLNKYVSGIINRQGKFIAEFMDDFIFRQVKKELGNITNVEFCENCNRVVMATIAGIRWNRKNFYQYGGDKHRTYSWCSKSCEKEANINKGECS